MQLRMWFFLLLKWYFKRQANRPHIYAARIKLQRNFLPFFIHLLHEPDGNLTVHRSISDFTVVLTSHWLDYCHLKQINASFGGEVGPEWRIISKQKKGTKKNEETDSLKRPFLGDSMSMFVPVCKLFLLLFGPWSGRCVCVLSRRWDHELKRRLMSQDVEAQTPICSLLHSGGRRSPQKPHSVSRRAHMLYVHSADTQQEGRALGSEHAG